MPSPDEISAANVVSITPADMNAGIGAKIKTKFQQLLAAPRDGTGASVCQPSATFSDLTWATELTAFMQLLFGEVIMFDDKCGPMGSDNTAIFSGRPGISAAASQQLGLVTRSVNCAADCCTLSKVQGTLHGPGTPSDAMICAGTMLGVAGGQVPDVNLTRYCRDVQAQLVVLLAPLLTSTTERVTCTYNPVLLATRPIYDATGAGLNGPWTVTATGNPATADARAYAWTTCLNFLFRNWNDTCLCPSGAHGFRSAQTDMCGGHGFCQQPSGDGSEPAPDDPADLPALTNSTYAGLNKVTAGTCACSGQYTGGDCTEPASGACPATAAGVTCGGHGSCSSAGPSKVCHCDPGWTGVACDVPECPVDKEGALCSGNGTCWSGVCICSSGFTGVGCNTAGKEPAVPVQPASDPKQGGGKAAKKKPQTPRQHLLVLVLGGIAFAVLLYYLFDSSPLAPAPVGPATGGASSSASSAPASSGIIPAHLASGGMLPAQSA